MKKFLILAVIAIALLQCTNNTPLPNGFELLDRDNKVGLVPPMTVEPVQTARFWKAMPAGSQSNLLLGAGQDAQSFIILQNNRLSQIDADDNLISAQLAFRALSYAGETLPFELTAHVIEQEWEESSVLWQDVKGAFAASPVETWQVTPDDSTWLYLEFSALDFLAQWIQDSHNDQQTIQGLVLKFEQAPGGFVLASSEATVYPPFMEIISQDSSGGLDTTQAFLTHDASLLQNLSGEPAETIIENPSVLKVGNATGNRSLLLFDVSEIPQEATVHKALLTFHTEQDQIWMPDNSDAASFTVAAGIIDSTSKWQDPANIVLDSRYSRATDVATGENDTFAFDSPGATRTMALFVQRWVSAPSANFGILLHPFSETNDFSEMAFKSGLSDVGALPTLEITYSLPPAHRFAQE